MNKLPSSLNRIFVVSMALLAASVSFALDTRPMEEQVSTVGSVAARQRSALLAPTSEAAADRSAGDFDLRSVGVDNDPSVVPVNRTTPPITQTQRVSLNRPDVVANSQLPHQPSSEPNLTGNTQSDGETGGMSKWLWAAGGAAVGGLAGYFGVPWLLGLMGICLGPIGAIVAGVAGAAILGFAAYSMMG
ncbi:MAG: hypothetical protein HY078_01960 [Elusimicrobia bacterium]|nr:hypothetical protein [Elusimicrobiota bacterium]